MKFLLLNFKSLKKFLAVKKIEVLRLLFYRYCFFLQGGKTAIKIKDIHYVPLKSMKFERLVSNAYF